MVDPYRMVVVNIIASLIVLFGTLFYRYVFPKKKINLFVLLLIISLLPCLSLLRAGDYESGDFNIHIYRIISFYNSLKEGLLLPSWAGDLNASYGNPLFIFNYSLPYYAISLFHFLSIDFISATKLYLGIVMYLSAVTMYLTAKEITGNKFAAFAAAVFYVFNPYHLIDVHFRATLGESTIFLIAPLIFFFITKYLKTNKMIWLILNSLVTALLVMAHPLLAVCFCVLSVFYILFLGFNKKNYKFVILSIASLMLGGIISSYVWITFILFAPYMYGTGTPNFIAPKTFYNIQYLLFSPWRFGFLFQGPKGELAQIIGYTQLITVAVLIVSYFKSKIKPSYKNHVLFWLGAFFSVVFLMLPLSIPFWKPLELFWMLLPFGRLSLLVAFATSILAAYLTLTYSNKKTGTILIFLLIALTTVYTILNWGQRRVIPQITEKQLIANVGRSTVYEGLTAGFLNNKWADPKNFWFSDPPKNHLDIVKGNGKVKQLLRTSIKHTYLVNALTPLTIRENTLYYPGWSMKTNTGDINIYPGYRGIIYAKLPKGNYSFELFYKDIPIYDFLKRLGIVLFLILIALIPVNLLWQRGKLRTLPGKP